MPIVCMRPPPQTFPSDTIFAPSWLDGPPRRCRTPRAAARVLSAPPANARRAGRLTLLRPSVRCGLSGTTDHSWLADDAALRGVEELHEYSQFGAIGNLLLQSLLGFFERQPRFVQRFIGAADLLDGARTESSPLQAFNINAMRLGGI